MNSKQLLVVGVASAAILLSGCHLLRNAVKGSGKPKTETRSVAAFDRVAVEGEAKVEISIGNTASVQITADDNLLPLITTKIDGTTLKIEQAKPLAPKVVIRIKIVTTSLKELVMAGSVSTTAIGLNEKSIKCTIAGSGRFEAKGTADTQQFAVAGSGRFDCLELRGDDVEVEIAGSGRAQVAANKNLKVKIAGSGEVTYAGEPKIEQEIAGSGSVQKSEQ